MSLTSVLIKNAFYNLGQNIRLMPTEVSINYRANKYLAAQKKEQKEEIKKQVKSAEVISEKVATDIAETTTSKFKQLQLVDKAIETKILVDYALYYMTHENAKLTKMPDKEKEFVNGIAAIFEFGKIYESAEVADLDLYDMNSTRFTGPFVVSIEEIRNNFSNSEFMKKLQIRKEQLAAELSNQNDSVVLIQEDGTVVEVIDNKEMDEDEIIHPIFFNNESLDHPVDVFPKQGFGISDDLFDKLESNLSKYLEGVYYRYEMGNNLINLIITRNYTQDRYIIDYGHVMGKGEMYVLANIPNDTIFVSLEYEDIVTKVLSNKYYTLSPDEYQQVVNEYFTNMSIYSYIDMTGTEWINDMKMEDYKKLGKKLTYIINLLRSMSNNQQLPRFRFNHWKSVDDFILISDGYVVSPFADTGVTSSVICEGMMYIVEGDNVIQKLGAITETYHIDKYGEL